MHKHATDPSIAMHGVMRILFVLCLVSVLDQGEYCASESLAENWCNLQSNAIHSMRRGAGRGKPEGRAGHRCQYRWDSSASNVVASLVRE